ncbi:MAG TPA: hypothetical protein VJO34_15860, partial [Methylomirabilota bacterium]|nr:hypothetical protein [Methylomirabilota bacterium]
LASEAQMTREAEQRWSTTATARARPPDIDGRPAPPVVRAQTYSPPARRTESTPRSRSYDDSSSSSTYRGSRIDFDSIRSRINRITGGGF